MKVQHGRQVIALDFVDDRGQTDTIEATPDHPFWVIGEGWVEAGELVEGDEVFTSSGGWMRLSGGTWLAGERTMSCERVGMASMVIALQICEGKVVLGERDVRLGSPAKQAWLDQVREQVVVLLDDAK